MAARVPAQDERVSYLALFRCLIFAHLARCAAAILALAAADMIRFLVPWAPDLSDFRPLIRAHRALWAAAILARAAALSLPRPRTPEPRLNVPANAATAALSPSNCLATLSRSAFNSARMSILNSSSRNIVTGWYSGTAGVILTGFLAAPIGCLR